METETEATRESGTAMLSERRRPEADILRRIAVGAITSCLLIGVLFEDLPRGAQATVAVALLMALGATGWWLSHRLSSEQEWVSQATIAATVALGLATLIPNFLGHFGLLRSDVFLAVASALFLAAYLLRSSATSKQELQTPAPDDTGKAELALMLLAGSAILVIVLRAAYELRWAPLGWMGLDDASYHGTAVALWNRYGDLRMPKFSFGDAGTAFYPIGSELQAWTLLAPFRDSDFFMRWSQLPFALASVLAVASVARRLRINPHSAALAALLYASAQRLLPELAFTTGNDCATAFYILASIDGALSIRSAPPSWIYPGIALGLLVGTKYLGLMFAVPIAPILFLVLLGDSASPRRAQVLVPAIATIVAVALLAGGYTYVRNAVVAGNPVFPFPVAIGGVQLPSWDRWDVGSRMQSPDAQIGGVEFLTRNRKRSLGALYRFTVLPAALLAPLVAWLLSWRRPWVPYILSLPLLFFLQFRYLVHDQQDVRYLMGALAIGAIAFAWLVDRLPAPASHILRRLLLLILFLSIVQLAGRGVDPKVMAFLGAVGLTAALLFVIRKIQKISVPRMIAPAAIVLLVTALFLDGPIQDYQFLKQKITLPHLPDSTAAGVLDNMVGPEGTAVAYVAGNQPYPFFGSLLQNELSIVPTKGPPQARFYDWSGDAEMPFGGNDAEVWLGNLKQLDVSHLVVIRAGNVDPERSWMLNRPESFRQIYQDAATEIWQSRPQAH